MNTTISVEKLWCVCVCEREEEKIGQVLHYVFLCVPCHVSCILQYIHISVTLHMLIFFFRYSVMVSSNHFITGNLSSCEKHIYVHEFVVEYSLNFFLIYFAPMHHLRLSSTTLVLLDHGPCSF